MTRSRLFILVGAVVLLLALSGLWQWRAQERDGSAALRRGLVALDKGDARTARIELMNAIKGNSRSVTARVAQARALGELGDGAGAYAEVTRARTLGASPAQTRAVMAQALLLEGKAEAALKEAQADDVTDAQRLPAARIAARAAMEMGDMARAQALLTDALTFAPSDAESWVDLGRLHIATGDQASAIKAADRAVMLAPESAKALTLRAELVRTQYGLTASMPWFDRALVANPDSVPALEQYAATLADAGAASRMLSLTRRILALDPGNARAWMMQAVMAARAGRADLARTLLARTHGRLDGEPATRLLRGVLHIEDGNGVLAAEALAPLVADQPDNRTARTLLARAYYDAGDFASAATTLARVVAQRDADPYILTLAARAQESLGNRAMANDMLVRAAWPVRAKADAFAGPRDRDVVAAPPANGATAQDNIPYIRALMSTGQANEAARRAEFLSNANPGAPDAWIIRGDTLSAAGRVIEAARAYEAAANIRFDRDVALRLAAAWARAGDGVRARQVAQLFLTQNPNDIDSLRLSAEIMAEAQDWRGAMRMLQAVRAQLGDGDAIVMRDLARAALESGDRARAVAYAAHAYRLMPGNPMMADIYGWTLMRTGMRGPAAVDLLEKAVALSPSMPMLQLHLGQAYAAAGRRAEARLALGKAAAVHGFAERKAVIDALAGL